MSNPFRNLKLFYHRLLGTKVRKLDGVLIATDASLPKFVRSVIYKGSYEDAERELLKRIVRTGDIVLEIGGGIGFIGLLAARLASPGRVVSFEANPKLQSVIKANYALNTVQPELRMQAVTIDGAPVTFHTSANVVSSSLYARSADQVAITVESVAMKTVIKEIRPNVLVMDVEGAEIDLLASDDFMSVRAILVELHPHIVGQDRISALLTSLVERGYKQTAQIQNNVLMVRQ